MLAAAEPACKGPADFWEPGKHETHRLKTSATSPSPLVDADLRTSSASSQGSQGTRRAAGGQADAPAGGSDSVRAGSGTQAPGRAGPSKGSPAKADMRAARPVTRAASLGALPGTSSMVRADVKLASARLKKQSSHKGGSRPAGESGEVISGARRASGAAAAGPSAGDAGDGQPAGGAGDAAATPRAASAASLAPSDAPEQAPEAGPSGLQLDPASSDPEGVGSYKEPSSSEPGSGEAETARSHKDAGGSDTASQAEAGAQELTASVRLGASVQPSLWLQGARVPICMYSRTLS